MRSQPCKPATVQNVIIIWQSCSGPRLVASGGPTMASHTQTDERNG